MFQQSNRFAILSGHAYWRIKNAFDLMGVIEDLFEMELLVRTELQAAELHLLIEQASDSFGVVVEDYLHD